MLLRGGQLARCLTTKTRIDAETETLIPTFGGRFVDAPIAFDTTQITSAANRSNPKPGDPCHPLSAGAHPPTIAFNARQDPDWWIERTGPLDTDSGTQVVCFSSKDHGADATVELAPTLRAMGHQGSHANGGGQLAVCIHADAIGRTGEAKTPSADAEGRVRLRNPGMGLIEDGTTYNLMASGQPHAVCVTGDVTHTLKAEGFDASEDGTGRGQPIVTAFKSGQSEAAGGIFMTEEYAPTLQAANNGSTAVPAIQQGMAVRRLTPRECERLQGFPDDYTQVPFRKKAAADGPRYKALGNSMAVPVMAWIGERIQEVVDISKLEAV